MTNYSISIYQCPIETEYCFRDYDEDKFNFSDYAIVYEGSLISDKTDADNGVLESIFEQFNSKYPRDYKGRSLSVSDIVCVNGRYYYCEPMGWQKIDVFRPHLSDREISEIIRDFVHKYLAPLVSADYIESIEDILVDDALHDIRESADRDFNDDDIRLAVGRSLVNRMGIEG